MNPRLHSPSPRHVYVHVPFCRSRCAYCGFHSTVGTPSASFPSDVAAEIHRQGPEGLDLLTLYIGGGTPTVLGTDGLARLCSALTGSLRHGTPLPNEWTIEANPGSLDLGLADTLRTFGVSRVSIGAQSFDAATLAVLGRTHSPGAVRSAVECVRRAGIPEVALDLIAGVPGLSDCTWRKTLDEATALEPEHLSVYALTVEPGTPLAADVAADRLRMPEDEAQMEALAVAETVLSARGYRRYEISNYAREGFECRHNLAVWRGEDYLGVGPAAASRWGLCRWINDPDLERWHAALEAGACPPRARECLHPAEDAAERLLTGLRLSEGIALARTVSEDGRWVGRLQRLSGLGVVEEHEEGRWRLTSRGREVADAVFRELLPA